MEDLITYGLTTSTGEKADFIIKDTGVVFDQFFFGSFCGNDNNEVIMRAFESMPPQVIRRSLIMRTF